MPRDLAYLRFLAYGSFCRIRHACRADEYWLYGHFKIFRQKSAFKIALRFILQDGTCVEARWALSLWPFEKVKKQSDMNKKMSPLRLTYNSAQWHP